MNPAKLHFSPQEMSLIVNADWILTKNDILKRISLLMGSLNVKQKEIIHSLAESLHDEITTTTPKISQGENYKGLPYLVLDYPRLFIKNNIFAIRTLFWWGKHISTTLHLSGKWQQLYSEKILKHYDRLASEHYLTATGDDEWVHHVTENNYKLLADLSKIELEGILDSKKFFKLVLFAPIHNLNHAVDVWEQQFLSVINIFQNDFSLKNDQK